VSYSCLLHCCRASAAGLKIILPAQAKQVELEALVGHLTPDNTTLREAVRSGAKALAAVVAKLGGKNLNASSEAKARL